MSSKGLLKQKRLLQEEHLAEIREQHRRWQEKTFTPTNGKPDPYFDDGTQMIYTPLDVKENNFVEEVGHPGEFPFLRGIHSTMYRGKLWTMRQFSGFGTPKETNARYHFLLKHGQTGL